MKSAHLNLIFFVLICLFSLASCESMVNDLDPDKLPDVKSKLVVECYISPQSKTIQAIVTESQPLFGVANYQIKVIKDAKVTLSGPSGQVVLPFSDSLSVYVLPASQFNIEAGKTYKITVSDPTRTVTASCTVPARSASLKKYTFDITEGKTYPGDTPTDEMVAKTKFYWDDIAHEKNYYVVRGHVSVDQNVFRYDYMTKVSEIARLEFKNEFNFAAITDNNADGLTLNSGTLETNLRNYNSRFTGPDGKPVSYDTDPKIKEIYVEILTVDDHYYKFKQTVGHNSEDNPFVEPTLVYTNIEGGLGCFAGFNASGTSIKP